MFRHLHLISLGRIKYHQAKVPDAHRHAFCQLCYVFKGRGYVELNGSVHEVSEGDLHLYYPDWAHDIWAQPHSALETIDVRFLLPQAIVATADRPGFLRGDAAGRTLHLLQAIEREGALRADPFWRDAAHTHLASLLIRIFRNQEAQGAAGSAVLSEAFGILRSSLPSGTEVDRLAARLHVSPAHLITLFRSHLGRTPQEVMIEMKLDRIRHELLVTRRPHISGIAQGYGWKDMRAFRRQFKQATGLTPSEFIVQHRQRTIRPYTEESWIWFDHGYPMRWWPASA